MIHDVIDLRRDKWIPRHDDSKPKFINEIVNDAKNEVIEQSLARESYRLDKLRDHLCGDDDKFRGGDKKVISILNDTFCQFFSLTNNFLMIINLKKK